MTLLVRDEVDIVAKNIEHHLSHGVDSIVAIDNGSTDGTLEILEEFSRQGVLSIIQEPNHDFSQSRWVTRAAIFARDQLGADWLLNNDADEFWTAPSGSLKDIFRKTDSNMLYCNRLNMVASFEDLDGQNWTNKTVFRAAEPVPQKKLGNIYTDPLPCPYFYLALAPKALMRAKGLVCVEQGNHSAVFNEMTVSSENAAVEIFHFPVRSRKQFQKKIIQGGMAYAANKEFSEHTGWHWRRWYKMYTEQGLDMALSDALPSRSQLKEELRTNFVIKDERFSKLGFASNLSTKG